MAPRKTKKRVPAALKRVRKQVPRPTRVQPSKKTYRRAVLRPLNEVDNGDEVGC